MDSGWVIKYRGGEKYVYGKRCTLWGQISKSTVILVEKLTDLDQRCLQIVKNHLFLWDKSRDTIVKTSNYDLSVTITMRYASYHMHFIKISLPTKFFSNLLQQKLKLRFSFECVAYYYFIFGLSIQNCSEWYAFFFNAHAIQKATLKECRSFINFIRKFCHSATRLSAKFSFGNSNIIMWSKHDPKNFSNRVWNRNHGWPMIVLLPDFESPDKVI